jgi:hypothetical protein
MVTYHKAEHKLKEKQRKQVVIVNGRSAVDETGIKKVACPHTPGLLVACPHLP